MRRLVGITCGLGAMVLAPTLAWADDTIAPLPTQPPATVTESTSATGDTVHLRNGGLFRGRVTEIVPGDHVTVRLDSGTSHRIAWVDVDRVIVASTAIPPLSTAAPKIGPEEAPPLVGPRARVHVKAPHPAFLYRRPAGSDEFVTACQAPCDEEMPLGDTYKVGGNGFSTTKEFHLDAPPGGTAEVNVDGPSWVGIVGGGALTVGGIFTAYVGTLVALAGSADSCDYCGDSGKSTRNAGLGVLGVGAGMIVLGLLIVYPSMKTDLEVSGDKGVAKDAFVRPPTWRTASATETGMPVTFPLLFDRRF